MSSTWHARCCVRYSNRRWVQRLLDENDCTLWHVSERVAEGVIWGETSWVPAFVNKHFWAGMSSTQWSESMNAFFDKYVNSKTTLKQFVEQYENSLTINVRKRVGLIMLPLIHWSHALLIMISRSKFRRLIRMPNSKNFKKNWGKSYIVIHTCLAKWARLACTRLQRTWK